MKRINAAIQLLPLKGEGDKYATIDKAISMIRESGLTYKVCPFETVVEGSSDAVYALIRRIQEDTLKNGCEELLINVKIHAATRDLAILDKLQKYQDESTG
jgi:uncharacterized protein YqgV (UPF0045/DUF77 family)